MKVKPTLYQLFLCCQELGLRKDIGKKAVASRIRSLTGSSDQTDTVIIRYACSLSENGIKLKNSKSKSDRIKATNGLKKIGNIFSKQNISNHNSPPVENVERELIRLNIPYEREKPVVVRLSKKKSDIKLYVLDFYLKKPINCIIEVDGIAHMNTKEYDSIRDQRLRLKGFGRTVRISAYKAMKGNFDLYEVLTKYKFIGQKIINYVQQEKDK